MCTAITFQASDFYFGRTLDLEYCYNEAVTVMPRKYPLNFRCGKSLPVHYAMIGMATIAENYPLYYDAVNEHGLSVAGLNFSKNAVYHSMNSNMYNIAPFELIPWILSQCSCVQEAINLLEKTNIAFIPFSKEYPLSDLHWILSDKNQCITLEPLKNGLSIIQNPVGVLTNNPPFQYHLYNLSNYMHLSEKDPQNTLTPTLTLQPYSRGMGALGLPGDLSSASRFIKAVYVKHHSVIPDNESESVTQFFHILGSVTQTEGCVLVDDRYEKTVYTSCCNTKKGIYYYTTYENAQISAISMHENDLSANKLYSYPLLRTQQIRYENCRKVN